MLLSEDRRSCASAARSGGHAVPRGPAPDACRDGRRPPGGRAGNRLGAGVDPKLLRAGRAPGLSAPAPLRPAAGRNRDAARLPASQRPTGVRARGLHPVSWRTWTRQPTTRQPLRAGQAKRRTPNRLRGIAHGEHLRPAGGAAGEWPDGGSGHHHRRPRLGAPRSRRQDDHPSPGPARGHRRRRLRRSGRHPRRRWTCCRPGSRPSCASTSPKMSPCRRSGCAAGSWTYSWSGRRRQHCRAWRPPKRGWPRCAPPWPPASRWRS